MLTAPKITIGLSTFNRSKLWSNERLFHSLLSQTVPPDEVIICDDGSEDDTQAVLKGLFTRQPLPFSFRLFHCHAPKLSKNQSSALPDNILYKEAKGDIFIHLDDDLWVHEKLVEFVCKLEIPEKPAAYYGEIVQTDMSGKIVVGVDPRRKGMIGVKEPFLKLKPENQAEWGAVWAAPLKTIREIGGNNMETRQYRGADARLGFRLREKIPTYFTTLPPMRVYHFGLPFIVKTPLHIVELDHKVGNVPNPLIANGGDAFWTSGALDSFYTEVKF